MEKIPVKKLKPNAILPTYGSAEAAGADLYACLDAPVEIAPGKTAFIPTGIAMELPRGYAGLAYARSGLACKKDLAPANKVGVIDSDYRGEFMIALHNHGEQVLRRFRNYRSRKEAPVALVLRVNKNKSESDKNYFQKILSLFSIYFLKSIF